MQEVELQQIKEVVRGVVKEELTSVKADVAVVKSAIESVDDKVEQILTTSKQQFDENTRELKAIHQDLRKCPTRDDFSDWRDKQVEPIGRDVDKLKYLHKDEWKGLPDSGTVSRILVEEGIKVHPVK